MSAGAVHAAAVGARILSGFLPCLSLPARIFSENRINFMGEVACNEQVLAAAYRGRH